MKKRIAILALLLVAGAFLIFTARATRPREPFEKLSFLPTANAEYLTQGFRDHIFDYQIIKYKSEVTLDKELPNYEKELLPKGYRRVYPYRNYLYARYQNGSGNEVHVIQGIAGPLSDDLESLILNRRFKPDLYSDIVVVSHSRPAGILDKLTMALHPFAP